MLHVLALMVRQPRIRACMAAFMQAEGAGLPHIPDLVLEVFDGPHTFTLLEVKTFDPCGATHIA